MVLIVVGCVCVCIPLFIKLMYINVNLINCGFSIQIIITILGFCWNYAQPFVVYKAVRDIYVRAGCYLDNGGVFESKLKKYKNNNH